jgi:hypothetical protein
MRIVKLIIAGLTLAAFAHGVQLEAFVGTWKLNVQQSQSKQPLGRGGSEVIELANNGLRIGHEWTTADGKYHQERYSCVLDGREHAMEREADAKHTSHTVRCKAIDQRTLEITTIHDKGVLVTVHRRALSNDGRAMRVTYFPGADTSVPSVMTAVYDRKQ